MRRGCGAGEGRCADGAAGGAQGLGEEEQAQKSGECGGGEDDGDEAKEGSKELTFDFKPKEINVTVEKLRELGYTVDWQGNELRSEDQIVELKPQDVILSKDCVEYLVKVAKFIDDLLVKFYGLEPFYNVEKPEDLIGHLIIGLAPHTLVGVLGRIIGFTEANVCLAHPLWHSAKRRDCDGDEDSLMLALDTVLNFSKSYLPRSRV